MFWQKCVFPANSDQYYKISLYLGHVLTFNSIENVSNLKRSYEGVNDEK